MSGVKKKLIRGSAVTDGVGLPFLATTTVANPSPTNVVIRAVYSLHIKLSPSPTVKATKWRVQTKIPKALSRTVQAHSAHTRPPSGPSSNLRSGKTSQILRWKPYPRKLSRGPLRH
jgi:hypothetical protein